MLFFAISGLVICIYIHTKKRASKVLVCPIGSNCDSVVHSEYSRFLGIHLEILGLIYYSFVSLEYLLIALLPETLVPFFIFISVLISGIALLLSIYLVFVQLFILRQICTWCLFSAALSAGIFAITAFLTPFSLNELVTGYGSALLLQLTTSLI